MKTEKRKKQVMRERRWVLFNNGCIHGIQHSELVMVRSVPHRSLVQNSVAVFTISRTFGGVAALSVLVVLMLLLGGCGIPAAQKGGGATSTISRPGHTNAVTLSQSENPKEPSRQTVQSEQTSEYVLPPGTGIGFVGDSSSKLGVGDRLTPSSHLQTPRPPAILAGPGVWTCAG